MPKLPARRGLASWTPSVLAGGLQLAQQDPDKPLSMATWGLQRAEPHGHLLGTHLSTLVASAALSDPSGSFPFFQILPSAPRGSVLSGFFISI